MSFDYHEKFGFNTMSCLEFDGEIGTSSRNHCTKRRRVGRLEFGRIPGKQDEMHREKPIAKRMGL